MSSSTIRLFRLGSAPKHIEQVLATLAVSLGPFACGLSKGYTSPALASLQLIRNSDFTVSPQEGSWIASLSVLGAFVGGPFGGFFMKFGRKRVLLSVCVPFSFCWLLTVFANSVKVLYCAAFLCGFFSAIILLVTHVYISEIATPSIRGRLGAAVKLSSHLGLLASYCLGAYLDWRRLAMVITAAPLMFLIAAFNVPETPSCLILHGREDSAEKSLQWLRGMNSDISEELSTIQANVRRQCQKTTITNRAFMKRRLIHPLAITCGVMAFQRLCGAHAFSFYAAPLFSTTFNDINPHSAAVVVGIVQLIGATVSGMLVDIIGRLPLLVASSLFMSVALAAFGTYVYIDNTTLQVLSHKYIGTELAKPLLKTELYSRIPIQNSNLDWVPLMCVIVFMLAYSIGVGPISWLLVGELFPLEYRNIGGAIATSVNYACAFIGVKTFVDFQELLGTHGTFWMYSGISILGLIFILLFVPETRGRELAEMESRDIIHA
ncbi:facilitated trehalose transporter Tret1-like [Artemia franciscana]|uniref:Major facilitator superfamily (MFS) profile domain-containing protein n=1 Tax=Artemia franciscana TaxID=6661 RepID=A0AA88HNX7_ARTSF|nr:hypothetical protein QYM36_009605 [Artemia franciscana]KAK2713779.1 hypothetical protein QYM36_009605 [Artemia franciscana]